MGDKTSEVPTDDAVPGRAFPLVELKIVSKGRNV